MKFLKGDEYMKKIPIINYVKVTLLVVFTFLLCIVVANNYKNKKAYQLENEHINSFLLNVKIDELSSYLTENHDGYIYMAPSVDETLGKFEMKLKKYITENELERNFVYLDSSNFSNDMYSNITNNFSDELKRRVLIVPECANVFFVRNGKIENIMYSEKKSITIDDVKSFISDNQVEA